MNDKSSLSFVYYSDFSYFWIFPDTILSDEYFVVAKHSNVKENIWLEI